MAEHTVTIHHEFRIAGGLPEGGVVDVVIEQATNSIRVGAKFAGDTGFDLDPAIIPEIISVLEEVAKLVAPQNLDTNSQDVLPQVE